MGFPNAASVMLIAQVKYAPLTARMLTSDRRLNSMAFQTIYTRHPHYTFNYYLFNYGRLIYTTKVK